MGMNNSPGERKTSPLRGKTYERWEYEKDFLEHLEDSDRVLYEVLDVRAHPGEALKSLPMNQKTEYTISIANLIYNNPNVNSSDNPQFSEELTLHGMQTALIYVVLLEILLQDHYYLVEQSPHKDRFIDVKHLQYLVALAYAHDIGKAPEYICRVARSKERFEDMDPGDAERSIFTVRQHTFAGAYIFERLGYEEFARSMLFCHHEREDGKGYPLGLKGLPAPIALLAAADSLASILEPSKEREKSWTILDLYKEIDRVFAHEKMSHAADIIKTMFKSVLQPAIINDLMVLPPKEVIMERIMERGRNTFIVQKSRPLRVLFDVEK